MDGPICAGVIAFVEQAMNGCAGSQIDVGSLVYGFRVGVLVVSNYRCSTGNAGGGTHLLVARCHFACHHLGFLQEVDDSAISHFHDVEASQPGACIVRCYVEGE